MAIIHSRQHELSRAATDEVSVATTKDWLPSYLNIFSLCCILLAIIIGIRVYGSGRDVSGLAIVQYATDRQYLCNALINSARLRRFDTLANLVVLVPSAFLSVKVNSPIDRLVCSLRRLDVGLLPLDMERADIASGDVTYRHSLQKLEILQLPYAKILFFDNDGLVLKNMDHLFDKLGDEDLRLPEAYYARQSSLGEDQPLYSSALMLIKPSRKLYESAQSLMRERRPTDFDMEIINSLTRVPSIKSTVLPYRHNLLLTGLFKDHSSYEGSTAWDAEQEYQTACYVHFSDAPMPKPWIDDRGASFAQHGPKCPEGGILCDDVRIWREIHRIFRDEMMHLCPSSKELDL